MRKIIQKICLGRESKLNMLFVLGVFIFVGLGCSNLLRNKESVDVNIKTPEPVQTASTPKTTTKKADASRGEIPSDDELQEMVKTTILDFSDAVQSADCKYQLRRVRFREETQNAPHQTYFRMLFGRNLHCF